MKNFTKLKAVRMMAGIIALVAVIGFSFAACDDGGGGNPPGGNPSGGNGGGGGGSAGNWTAVADSKFGTTNIRAIAYGGGKFVAGGTSGKMAYSSDGVTWTAVTDFSTNNNRINAIVYGNNKFVAVCESGRIATSSDGVTWKVVEVAILGKTPSGIAYDIEAIAYGSGKFVAGGEKSGIATSVNGENWTAITTTAFDRQAVYQNIPYTEYTHINAITYGGGKFVAGGNGKMATSTDGENWTAVPNETFNIDSIAYGGGKFVAGGETKMLYSSDGVTWTEIPRGTGQGKQPFFNSSGALHITAIVYENNKFVAVGHAGKIATSTDGATWTAVTTTAFDYQAQGYTVQYSLKAIAYGGGKFVVCGDSGRMWYSTGL